MNDQIAPLPAGPFACIYADPAWAYKTFKRDDALPSRAAVDPYRTMPLRDIKALPVAAVAAKDCHLFLWVTGPFLNKGFEVMASWGFRYSAVGFTWIKLKASHNPNQLRVLPTAESDLFVGMGYTTRKNAEFCLIGRRGSPRRLAKDVREVILSPVRDHSRKPDETYDRIERYCAGPRLELFARTQRPGWTAWGNQTEKFANDAR